MKILSMTATFGKLSRQTLTFREGLNIIEAPNEWGKSTWCAFLLAMLYGIDTREQTKNGYLAVKEHYKPWSGEPMSGSMDILWEGRKITIQRQNKRVTPFGEVKAFETETGVPVPELCVPAPGQVLLGVERSVFARAGFLKLSEMPVTEDESLRRRLNELVTTGDESGASDYLADKLNALKNKCRSNSKKGLLPEAEAELKQVSDKLEQLGSLQYQISSIKSQQETLAEKERRLENHKQALRYNEQLQYAQKLKRNVRICPLRKPFGRISLVCSSCGIPGTACTQKASFYPRCLLCRRPMKPSGVKTRCRQSPMQSWTQRCWSS